MSTDILAARSLALDLTGGQPALLLCLRRQILMVKFKYFFGLKDINLFKLLLILKNKTG